MMHKISIKRFREEYNSSFIVRQIFKSTKFMTICTKRPVSELIISLIVCPIGAKSLNRKTMQ